MERKSVKGTQTERNLLMAFLGESQARNKYTFFASVAKKEGYEQISGIFTETADNEKEHAKRYYSYLEPGTVDACLSCVPVGLGNTIQNLKMCIQGEHEEWSHLYPGFGEIADEEGFPEIGNLFRRISIVENHHEKRYQMVLENLENGKVFVKDQIITWKCRNCGYVHTSNSAPELCPACLHPKAYFEILCDNL